MCAAAGIAGVSKKTKEQLIAALQAAGSADAGEAGL
jgi:hypothetical protein